MLEANELQTGFAGINGTQFYYEVAGTGYPLVLVHAGIADRRMWDAQVRAFAQHYKVIRYDMRGYGKTAMVAGPFSHHQDLYDLLRFLGIEHAHLLGCSKGGTTIIDFTLEHPEMVSALVLVAATPSGYELRGDPPKQWDELVAAYKQHNFARASELEVQIWVDGPHRTPDQVDPTIRDRVREMNMIALATEASELGSEQPLEPAAVNRLAELHVPTLVIVGDLDVPKLVTAGELLASKIVGAAKAVIPGTAHLPNLEQPEAFNQIVLDFLRRW